jgi:anti-sigma factor RsiW
MQHLDEGTIHAWLDGALDAEESARVDRHAAECATCAAAVAEARGLVAGASRILGALDHVPGGVVPRAAGASLGSARSSRSLWRVLHVTPVRAAAAAILIVAAGTVLVLRHAPNGIPAVDTEAGPEALQPPRDVPVTSRALPAPTVLPSPAGRPAIASSPKVTGHVFGKTSGARAAAPAAEHVQVAIMDSTAQKNSAMSAASPIASNAAESLVRAAPASAPAPSRAKMAVAGGVAGDAQRAGVAQLATTTAPSRHAAWVGCYSVIADPAAALPSRLALDSTRVEAAYAVRVLRLGNAQPSGTNLVWQETPDGGVRLSAPGNVIDRHAASPELLTGTKTIDNRQIQITLHRLPDCSER